MNPDVLIPIGLTDPAEAWRLEQLLTAGYSVELAEKLAAARDVDLHQALDLVSQGCTPGLAAEILL